MDVRLPWRTGMHFKRIYNVMPLRQTHAQSLAHTHKAFMKHHKINIVFGIRWDSTSTVNARNLQLSAVPIYQIERRARKKVYTREEKSQT